MDQVNWLRHVSRQLCSALARYSACNVGQALAQISFAQVTERVCKATARRTARWADARGRAGLMAGFSLASAGKL